jgi:hypothetical protein
MNLLRLRGAEASPWVMRGVALWLGCACLVSRWMVLGFQASPFGALCVCSGACGAKGGGEGWPEFTSCCCCIPESWAVPIASAFCASLRAKPRQQQPCAKAGIAIYTLDLHAYTRGCLTVLQSLYCCTHVCDFCWCA